MRITRHVLNHFQSFFQVILSLLATQLRADTLSIQISKLVVSSFRTNKIHLPHFLCVSFDHFRNIAYFAPTDINSKLLHQSSVA